MEKTRIKTVVTEWVEHETVGIHATPGISISRWSAVVLVVVGCGTATMMTADHPRKGKIEVALQTDGRMIFGKALRMLRPRKTWLHRRRTQSLLSLHWAYVSEISRQVGMAKSLRLETVISLRLSLMMAMSIGDLLRTSWLKMEGHLHVIPRRRSLGRMQKTAILKMMRMRKRDKGDKSGDEKAKDEKKGDDKGKGKDDED